MVQQASSGYPLAEPEPYRPSGLPFARRVADRDRGTEAHQRERKEGADNRKFQLSFLRSTWGYEKSIFARSKWLVTDLRYGPHPASPSSIGTVVRRLTVILRSAAAPQRKVYRRRVMTCRILRVR